MKVGRGVGVGHYNKSAVYNPINFPIISHSPTPLKFNLPLHIHTPLFISDSALLSFMFGFVPLPPTQPHSYYFSIHSAKPEVNRVNPHFYFHLPLHTVPPLPLLDYPFPQKYSSHFNFISNLPTFNSNCSPLLVLPPISLPYAKFQFANSN